MQILIFFLFCYRRSYPAHHTGKYGGSNTACEPWLGYKYSRSDSPIFHGSEMTNILTNNYLSLIN